jgi:hypothetical protein
MPNNKSRRHGFLPGIMGEHTRSWRSSSLDVTSKKMGSENSLIKNFADEKKCETFFIKKS